MLGILCKWDSLSHALTCKYIYYFMYTSHHFTPHVRMNSINWPRSQCVASLLAQLVEHGTGIAVVTGLNPVEALIFFRLVLLLRWPFFVLSSCLLRFSITCELWNLNLNQRLRFLLPSIKFPAVSDYCRACSTHMEDAVSQHGGQIS